MMTRAFSQRLPIFACAGFVAFIFLANLWNWSVGDASPKLRIRSASPVAGLTAPAPVAWSLESILSGDAQRAFSRDFGQTLPIFPISVRAKNQLVYALFGTSAARGVAIGRKGQLFEQVYVDEFCTRDATPDLERIAAWAGAIREIEEAVESAGKRFVYLISPSKAARYSEDLPADARCASRAAVDMPDKLAPYLAALKERSVRVVDGAGLVSARRGDFDMPLFPRGGTHWNRLAAALALQELTRAAPSAIGEFAFVWSPAPEPVGSDRDLADLFNLLWPDLSYPTPFIARAGAPAACSRAPKLLAAGGSFLEQILAAATLAPCAPQADHWFYMRSADNGVTLAHYRHAPGFVGKGEKSSAEMGVLDDDLRAADVVFLEENEANIGKTQQVAALRDAARRALRR